MNGSTPSLDDPLDRTPTLSRQPIPDLSAPPRLRRPDRPPLVVRPRTIDDLVPEDHPVRAVWAWVLRWDLTRFLQGIRARGERPGRAATDPQWLIAVWLYAPIAGLGCGRQLARLGIESDPDQWRCGGVSLPDQTRNEFRVDHEEALDDLLTQMIAVLTQAQIVSVPRIAQDGTRIRARAGANRFGERETLEKHLEAARAPLETVQPAAADPTLSAPPRAARERGARERPERREPAPGELKEVEQAKAEPKDKPTKDHPARASSTDPEAGLRRMPDGGPRPASHRELATDGDRRAMVGVEATQAGRDAGPGAPMRDQVEERADEAIEEQWIDGGFVSREGIERAAAAAVTIAAPVPKPRKAGVDRHVPKPTDSAAVAEWRQRMGPPATKHLEKQRRSTIATINGEWKTERGLGRVRVRGLRKVQGVALGSALASNAVPFGAILRSGAEPTGPVWRPSESPVEVE
jgi:transposase